MAVTPTGSDGSLPVTIVAGSISSSSSEKTTLASCTTLDELYKIAVTGTGQASSPSINLILKDFRATGGTANTYSTIVGGNSTTTQVITQDSGVVYVSSDSARDTSAGTGLRTVKIFGLDSSYAEISETITMNGTTPVASANNYIAINHAIPVTFGSGAATAGVISIKNTAASQNLMTAIVGSTSFGNAVFTVPAGKTGILYSTTLSTGLATLATTACIAAAKFKTSHPTLGSMEYAPVVFGATNTVSPAIPPVIHLPEKTTFWMDIKGGSASQELYGNLKIILVGSILTNVNTYWS